MKRRAVTRMPAKAKNKGKSQKKGDAAQKTASKSDDKSKANDEDEETPSSQAGAADAIDTVSGGKVLNPSDTRHADADSAKKNTKAAANESGVDLTSTIPSINRAIPNSQSQLDIPQEQPSENIIEPQPQIQAVRSLSPSNVQSAPTSTHDSQEVLEEHRVAAAQDQLVEQSMGTEEADEQQIQKTKSGAARVSRDAPENRHRYDEADSESAAAPNAPPACIGADVNTDDAPPPAQPAQRAQPESHTERASPAMPETPTVEKNARGESPGESAAAAAAAAAEDSLNDDAGESDGEKAADLIPRGTLHETVEGMQGLPAAAAAAEAPRRLRPYLPSPSDGNVADSEDSGHGSDSDSDSASDAGEPRTAGGAGGRETLLLAALGELPPEFSLDPAAAGTWGGSKAGDRPGSEGSDQDADAFPPADGGVEDEEEGDGEGSGGGGGGGEGSDVGGSARGGIGAAVDDGFAAAAAAAADPGGGGGGGEAGGGDGSVPAAGTLAAAVAGGASVSELFARKAPERAVDPGRRLPVAWVVRDDAEWPTYEACEEASWLYIYIYIYIYIYEL
jgi:hypothetical protein